MSDPVVAQKSPFIVELEPGKYLWCACGRSKNQPFCDGSHDGTDFAPVEFEIVEKSKITLCGCKRTKSPPECCMAHSEI